MTKPIKATQQLDEAIAMYIVGRDTKEIYELTGIPCNTTFKTALANRGLNGERKKALEQQKQQKYARVRELYLAGKSYDEIVSLCGISKRTITKVIGASDIKKRIDRDLRSQDNLVTAVARSYTEGNSLKKVAVLYGISTQSVLKILHEQEVPIREPFHYDDIFVDMCVDLYLTGKSSIEIGRLYGIKPGLVTKWVRLKGHATRGRSVYPHATINRVLGEYIGGKSFMQLERETGIGTGTIYLWLKERGLSSRGQAKTPQEIQNLLVSEYISGVSTVQLQKKYRLTTKTIVTLLNENGVVCRPRGTKKTLP